MLGPYWRLFYHVVWATRHREPLIAPAIEEALYRELSLAARRLDIPIHAVGGTSDHVHLVISIPPAMAVAAAVGRLKGASSRAINLQSEQTGEFGWQHEYGVVSFAERHLPQVIDYVTHQKQHHAARTLWQALERMEPVEQDGLANV